MYFCIRWHHTVLLWISSTCIVLFILACKQIVHYTFFFQAKSFQSVQHHPQRTLTNNIHFYMATPQCFSMNFKYIHCVVHCSKQICSALYTFLLGGVFSERTTTSANNALIQYIFIHCKYMGFISQRPLTNLRSCMPIIYCTLYMRTNKKFITYKQYNTQTPNIISHCITNNT
jgi:hypothetical protein